jgi:hypothetical protein
MPYIFSVFISFTESMRLTRELCTFPQSERIEQIASAAYESIAHLDRYEKECERLYLKIAHMNSTAIDNFATQGVYLAEIHAIVTPLYHGIPLKDVDGDYVIDESEETIDASLEEAFRSCEDMVAEIAALQ